jgi:hypothetical protein
MIKEGYSGLIGYTGFVGESLVRTGEFDYFYNRKNINEICDCNFNEIVCAGLPGKKWLANLNPMEDEINLNKLIVNLKRLKTKKFILISTADVYENKREVDEDSFDFEEKQAYGRNRRKLEKYIAENYSQYIIIRLPALYGPGLKKNILYDLINNHETKKIIAANEYQWYGIENLMGDIKKLKESKFTGAINFTSKPISVRELIRNLNYKYLIDEKSSATAKYDIYSKHGNIFKSNSGCYTHQEQMNDIKKFVDNAK